MRYRLVDRLDEARQPPRPFLQRLATDVQRL
jgi:hypothetical protein